MTDQTVVTQSPEPRGACEMPKTAEKRPDLHTLWQHPERLPEWVAQSPTLTRYLDLLDPLAWGHVPERNLVRNWGQTTLPYVAVLATYLLKLNEGLPSLGAAHRFVREHSGLKWLLGFPGGLTSEREPDFNAGHRCRPYGI